MPSLLLLSLCVPSLLIRTLTSSVKLFKFEVVVQRRDSEILAEDVFEFCFCHCHVKLDAPAQSCLYL